MRYSHPEDSLKDAVEKLANFTINRSNFRSNKEYGTRMIYCNSLKLLVGVAGLEPAASASRTQRSSQSELHPDEANKFTIFRMVFK